MNTPFLAVQVDFVEKGPVRFPLLRLYSMAPNPNAIDATRVSIHQERDGRRFVLLPISFVSSLEREREREREREKSLLVGVSFSLIVYSLSLSAVFVLGDLSFSRPSADLYPAASISFRFDGSNVIVFNARRLWTDPTVQTTTPSISRVDGPTGNERRERERERDGISKRRQLSEVAGNLMGPYMFFHVIGNFQDVGQQSSVIQSHTAQRVALELWLSDGRQRFKWVASCRASLPSGNWFDQVETSPRSGSVVSNVSRYLLRGVASGDLRAQRALQTRKRRRKKHKWHERPSSPSNPYISITFFFSSSQRRRFPRHHDPSENLMQLLLVLSRWRRCRASRYQRFAVPLQAAVKSIRFFLVRHLPRHAVAGSFARNDKSTWSLHARE